MLVRLTLIQWLSPAFPTGGFAYSHGLETWIDAGRITTGATFQDWLTGVLTHGAGWQDAVLLALALRENTDHAALADLARALAPSRERLAETQDQGAALARTITALTGRSIPAAPLPVALGQAASPLNLPPAEVIAQYLASFAGNLTSVATRAIPLGQTEAQTRLAALHPTITTLATRAASAGPDNLANAAIAADIAAMRHETLTVRLFKT